MLTVGETRPVRSVSCPVEGGTELHRVVKSWVAAAAVVSLVGCGGVQADDRAQAETSALEPIGQPGVDRSPFDATYGSATSAGSDLVVIEAASATGRRATALRQTDGTWWALPDLPFEGYIQLASANDRAVAGGIGCTNGDCSEGELVFAMLSEDQTEWVQLEVPDVELSPTETEMTTTPGLGEFADFGVGDGYRVDDAGVVSRLDGELQYLPGTELGTNGKSNEVGCSFGDSYFSMQTAYPNPERIVLGDHPGLVGDIYVQELDDSAGPESLGPVLPGAPVAGAVLCEPGAVTVHGPDTAATFDIDSRTWTTGPSNLLGLTLGTSPISGRYVTASDGTVFEQSSRENRIIRHLGGGMWEDTGAAGHVFATDDAVLVIGADRSVTVVDPT